ncbi:MAG TPA: sigma-70 family RNA polymerase sigma factor [Clostridia bacterium]|nr:sigma-70 family RNA polymerase sigma factor [Clostridia bacterium]
MSFPDGATPGPADARFVTTHWSVVLAAGQTDVTRAQTALARLCQTYWYPLYAYVRRRGYSPHDAQDLTQAFFEHLLERHALASADPARGRFRSFILTALNHFLASEWTKAHAQKRGGDHQFISLDLAAAEKRYDLEPVDTSSPDKLFDKQWALTLLDEVLNRLEAEYQQNGKADLFAVLKQTLTGASDSQPYALLATKLSMNENTVKVAVHRLRKRYRELLRIEISNTVADPGEADEELRELFNVLVT